MNFKKIKNVGIWLCHGPNKTRMPIYGLTFFGHDSVIFCQFPMKFRIKHQKTILYRNPGYEFKLPTFFKFWADFGRELGVATIRPLAQFIIFVKAHSCQ